MGDTENILVSVCMITYGHEKYIREAIEGVLMQETSFKYDLIVSNDSSPDSTDEIISEIIRNHPKGNKIKYFLHKENIGMQLNSVFAFEKCKGKYIAICEGDDYWVDSSKLQKQIEFLEANPTYSFSMGRVDMFMQSTGEITQRPELVNPHKKETYVLKDYIKNPFSQTSSFVFRNSNEPIPDWFKDVHAGDQSLVVIKTGVDGKIKYHPDLFSIYRVNTGSVSNTVSYNVYEKFLGTLKYWQSFLNNNYSLIFKIIHYKYTQYIKFQKCDLKILRGYYLVKIKVIDCFLKFI